MFTGIIKKISTIQKIEKRGGNIFLSIKTPAGWQIFVGQSLSINGVCSTVKVVGHGQFQVEYMPETLKKTTASLFKISDMVNLEMSLKLNDFVDGHLVQGHIDGIGKIMEVKKAGWEHFISTPPNPSPQLRGGKNLNLSIVLKISAPKQLMKFIAPKGSIAVDGISLTVVDVGKNWFTVSLVSYTLENTNLGKIKRGDRVNLETDVIAKYIGASTRK
ncbi:MAG: hypothetical protein A2174_02635 [Candidatus Portnoybacteria bacterium RBG_13_41_18]|uniref:Riboflavin synthase n=1 Tax=Candidatus Portnoybacteria bacterium RBG_13_41_18 TaxID=1801991 RepID=A0A1G2F9Q4_9BACT|nr:MAG: hypothetical protein A2174_02635 [Candidatus Portnoybacteria bacterium RBG_13_41_18]